MYPENKHQALLTTTVFGKKGLPNPHTLQWFGPTDISSACGQST